MKKVTQKEFFKALYADPRDIMPSIEGEYNREKGGYLSRWMTKARVLFGESQGKNYYLA